MRWLRDFLRAFASEGRTVLVSSHMLAEVAQTVHQVLIINRGRLVVESSQQALTARVGGAVRVRTPRPDRLHEALRSEHPDATREDLTLHEGSSLEEIFLELTSPASA